MKNKLLYIGFVIALQATRVVAMDGCCDHKSLVSTSKRYALSIANSEEVNAEGISKDLQFLSPDAINSQNFAKYMQENSFDIIAKQATTKHQEQAVKIFRQEFESIKTDDLLKLQLCLLLDKVIVNLRPSIPINVYTHPILKPFKENPSLKFQSMLLPSLIDDPTK